MYCTICSKHPKTLELNNQWRQNIKGDQVERQNRPKHLQKHYRESSITVPCWLVCYKMFRILRRILLAHRKWELFRKILVQGRFEFGEARLKYGLLHATNDDWSQTSLTWPKWGVIFNADGVRIFIQLQLQLQLLNLRLKICIQHPIWSWSWSFSWTQNLTRWMSSKLRV